MNPEQTHLYSTIDDLIDNVEYLTLLNVVANLLSQHKNERVTGAKFSREWRMDKMTVKVSYNDK